MDVTRISRAERKDLTRTEVVAAAHDVFRERGFHAASVDAVAAAAGYTKGAVYSSFAGKEDLFFAVYEARVQRSVEELREILSGTPVPQGPAEAARRALARRDPGWLAVFFEFWAHVLRHDDLRERFAALHRRAQVPLVEASRGLRLPPGVSAEDWTRALFGMVTGIALEQLTDPDLDGGALAVRMIELATAGLEEEEGR